MATRGDVRRLFRSVKRADTLFVRSGLGEPRYRMPGRSSDRVRYSGLVTSERWDRLAGHGARRVEQSAARLALLTALQTQIAGCAADLRSGRTVARTVPLLADSPRWDEIRQGALAEYGSGSAADRRRVTARLDEIERWSVGGLMATRAGLLQARATDLDRTARQLLSYELAGRFAVLVAGLNTAAVPGAVAAPAGLDQALADLDTGVSSLQALVAAADWPGVRTGAAQLADDAFGLVAAYGPAARSTAHARNVGAALRRAFDVAAEARWVAWVAGWNGLYGAARWPRVAATRAQSPVRTAPRGTVIDGVVTDLTITHERGKAISLLRVATDRGTQRVGLPGIKIDSCGIVPGASVSLLCGPRERLPWANDVTGRQLRRYDLSTNARRRWGDWLAAQARDIFHAWPNAVAAEWSLQPGADGAGNPLRYGVWTSQRSLTEVPYGSV